MVKKKARKSDCAAPRKKPKEEATAKETPDKKKKDCRVIGGAYHYQERLPRFSNCTFLPTESRGNDIMALQSICEVNDAMDRNNTDPNGKWFFKDCFGAVSFRNFDASPSMPSEFCNNVDFGVQSRFQ